MTKVLTKLELAIHILKNIAENGEWKNDLEAFSSCEGWFESENSLGGMISVLEEGYDMLDYRVKQLPVTYKIGDRFKCEDDGSEYILCMPATNKVCLISLADGSRWVDPKNIVNPVFITEEEFFSHVACRDVFTKIE